LSSPASQKKGHTIKQLIFAKELQMLSPLQMI